MIVVVIIIIILLIVIIIIIHRIIHEELGMTRVCAKWVPHFLAGAQKVRVRCAKQMLATFT